MVHTRTATRTNRRQRACQRSIGGMLEHGVRAAGARGRPAAVDGSGPRAVGSRPRAVMRPSSPRSAILWAMQRAAIAVQTLRALAAPRRLIPILVVITPLLGEQAQSRAPGAMLVGAALCAACVVVAPVSWRVLTA